MPPKIKLQKQNIIKIKLFTQSNKTVFYPLNSSLIPNLLCQVQPCALLLQCQFKFAPTPWQYLLSAQIPQAIPGLCTDRDLTGLELINREDRTTEFNCLVMYKLKYIYFGPVYLAHSGTARGCFTNTVIINS